MLTTIEIVEPTVYYELTVSGAVVFELVHEGERVDIRLAFDRWQFDSSTPLGGRRITRHKAVQALRALGRNDDECQITVNRCWRAAVIAARYRF